MKVNTHVMGQAHGMRKVILTSESPIPLAMNRFNTFGRASSSYNFRCHVGNNRKSKTRFIRRISAVSNAIETIDNEMICFIIFCLNCIRHGRNATFEPGLRQFISAVSLTNKWWKSQVHDSLKIFN